MTPATIIQEAQSDGVRLALSPAGTIKATGDGAAVNRWLAVIRERKAEIINVLKVASPTDEKTADAVTSWGWLLHFADRNPLEVYRYPDATHAGILERYPDALGAEPIPERTRRNPTETEVAELRALVKAIGKTKQWNDGDFEWATAAALADPDGALTSFRATAVENGIILPLDDDRRPCDQCANLAGLRCLAAWRGEIMANRDYAPVPHIPRRCEGYAPGADDPDKRPDLERWPELIQKGSK